MEGFRALELRDLTGFSILGFSSLGMEFSGFKGLRAQGFLVFRGCRIFGFGLGSSFRALWHISTSCN